jgi:hypothetical protein
VDDGAYFLNLFFEDAVRRGVGDHERGKLVPVLPGFFPERAEVDVPALVAPLRRLIPPGPRSRVCACAEEGMSATFLWLSPLSL